MTNEHTHHSNDRDEYKAPHVCNYASRYQAKMCARRVTDGHRYCWQHRR